MLKGNNTLVMEGSVDLQETAQNPGSPAVIPCRLGHETDFSLKRPQLPKQHGRVVAYPPFKIHRRRILPEPLSVMPHMNELLKVVLAV